MEGIPDNQTHVRKVYKDKSIGFAAFLGGPLAAGYIIAANYKTFNEPQHVVKTWIFTVLATTLIFAFVFSIPDDVKAGPLISALYTAIAYFLLRHLQGQRILDHIDSGGQVFGWGRTACVGLISLAVTLAAILFAAFLAGDFSNSVTTKTYGMMKHEISFEKGNISEAEVERLAHGFITSGFFDQAVTKCVYAEKVDSNYELSIAVIEGIENDSEALEPLIQVRNELQVLFPDNKIILNLVVDDLDHVVKRFE